MDISTKILNYWGKVCYRLFNLYDLYWDMRICGASLVRYVQTPWRKTKGSTGSSSTHYMSLHHVFSGATFADSDKFIDVGCGKGRVLAYAIKMGFPGAFTGIEHNPEVAAHAQRWTGKYKNLKVISGDAFQLDYNEYNHIFLARPFEPWAFKEFIPKLERELRHPVTFYYWVDQQSGHLLRQRPGWKCLRSGSVYRKWGLFSLEVTPQGYSVWTYTPGSQQMP